MLSIEIGIDSAIIFTTIYILGQYSREVNTLFTVIEGGEYCIFPLNAYMFLPGIGRKR